MMFFNLPLTLRPVISKQTIARIQDEARVYDVISDYMPLRKRGVNYLGLCPFHNEKTPSFTVSPVKNLYKCFGCGKAGGAISFLMDAQQMSYVDALKHLARKYNIAVEEIHDEKSKEEQEQQSKTESIFIANTAAQKFYSEYLNSPDGSVGMAYLRERGFSETIIEKFQLGYAPERSDAFTQHALKNGYKKEVLLEAKLTGEREGRLFDFFRNRVMFPIHNPNGKVVGFGGRIMAKDDKSPKYINTPESEVYQKSKILYGIFQARQAIRKADECILCEGYTDVVSLHQAGVENAVASSGTAFTEEQARLIKRYTSNVCILYDGDAAGIKAAQRGSDILLESGLNVRVVVLPEPEDPDSYVRMVGATEFVKYVNEKKRDIILFRLSLTSSEARKDPIKKSELLREIVKSIALIPDNLLRSMYTKECATLLDVPEQVLIVEVNKQRRNKLKEDRQKLPEPDTEIGNKYDFQLTEEFHRQQMQVPVDSLMAIERDIVRTLLEYGDWTVRKEDESETTITAYVIEELEGLKVESPQLAKTFQYITAEFSEGRVHPASFYSSFDADNEIAVTATDLLFEKYPVSPNWWDMHKVITPQRTDYFMRDVESCILRLKQRKVNEMMKEIDEQLKMVTDEQVIAELMKRKQKLLKQRTLLYKHTGTVVYRPVQ